jgi:hypothetical protein
MGRESRFAIPRPACGRDVLLKEPESEYRVAVLFATSKPKRERCMDW